MEAALVVLPGSFETRITMEMSPPPWSRTEIPPFLCKKDAASWIRDQTIDQTNTEE